MSEGSGLSQRFFGVTTATDGQMFQEPPERKLQAGLFLLRVPSKARIFQPVKVRSREEPSPRVARMPAYGEILAQKRIDESTCQRQGEQHTRP